MTRPIRVMELRSVRGTGGGPDKTILTGAAHADRSRFAVTACYVRDRRDGTFGITDLAHAIGSDYTEVLERHSLDWRIWRPLLALIREHRIDILHAHDYKTDVLAFLLARYAPVRLLATAHGWITNTWRERFYTFWDQRVLSRYPMVIAVSNGIRDTLILRGAEPSRVRRIPNGVDPVRFQRTPGLRERMREALGIGDDALVIGSFGRLVPEKRHDVLLRAVRQLPATMTPILLLAGDGPEARAIQALAAALDLSPRVRMLGYRTDVPRLHHAVDVYVQSSDTEGVPNAVLEAMAIEVPVVATNVGGTSEAIEDGVQGLLVAPGDSDGMARAIAATVADRDAACARVAAARTRIETDLSFDVRQARVERVYEELVQ